MIEVCGMMNEEEVGEVRDVSAYYARYHHLSLQSEESGEVCKSV